MAKNKVGLILNCGLTATRLYTGWLKQMGALDKVVIKLLDYEATRKELQYFPLTGPTKLLEEKVAELRQEGCIYGAIGCFSLQKHAGELFTKYRMEHIRAANVLLDYKHRAKVASPYGILGTISAEYFSGFNRMATTRISAPLWPSANLHNQLNHDILYRMSRYAPEQQDYEIITECTKDLIKQGAKRIIIGCTDIVEACPKAFDGTRFIDLPFLHAKEIARVANENL